MADYKEGVDFEWVLAKNQPKGGTNKTRRFFSAAEKAALKAPKAAPVKAKAATPKKTATGPISGASRSTAGKVSAKSGASRSVAGKVSAKSGASRSVAGKVATTPVKMPTRPVTPTRSPTATGRYSEYEAARLGSMTEAQWDALTPAQREAKGLPVSWIDYIRSGGDSAVKKPAASTIAQAGKVGRYAKGGMVKKQKGKC